MKYRAHDIIIILSAKHVIVRRTMKTKITYSQVQKALNNGFLSPLNNQKKKAFFDKIRNVSRVGDFQITKVVKRGTKREFFRIERDGVVVCKTMFARKYDAERVARTTSS